MIKAVARLDRPRRNIVLVAGLAALVSLAGCATHSPDVYSPGGLEQASKVDRAVVKSIRTVDVNDPTLGLGAASGAAAGAIGGASIGRGNAALALGGALVGGAIGALAEQKLSASTAFEYVLEKSDGDLMSIAQQQAQPYPIGSRVLIIYGQQAKLILDETGK